MTEFNIQKSTQEMKTMTAKACKTEMTFKEVDVPVKKSVTEHATVNVTLPRQVYL